MRAAVLGIAGTTIDPDERALFQARPPAGIILFARNVETPSQLAQLVADLHAILPERAIVMIDQEGGRVARLRPPHWRAHPSAAAIGAAQSPRAAFASGALIGLECADAGIDVVAAPVLDVATPDADPIIGDRAFSHDPSTVALLGEHFSNGLLSAGVQPVGKHVPGHGRAIVDSHHRLPELAPPTDDDLLPFHQLGDMIPWLMTAHILYPDLDPTRPATLSPIIINRLIRGRLAFNGVLVTDDLTMRALTGAQPTLASAAIEAGCDLALSCGGDLATNAAILDTIPPVTDRALHRLQAAADLARLRRVTSDPDHLAAERDQLLA